MTILLREQLIGNWASIVEDMNYFKAKDKAAVREGSNRGKKK